MEAILPTNEYTEVEGRVYANPQVAIDESNTFIDNLRSTQGQQNQEIFTDTRMLGTDIPTVQGGLMGAESYFTSRYQTPQTNSAIANLRAIAQASALNQALANEQAVWKKRYNDAYKNYQKRQYDRANAPTTTGGVTGGVDYEDTESEDRTVAGVKPSYSPLGSGDFSYTSTSDRLNSGTISANQGAKIQGPTNTLTPSGNVNIQRNKYGDITSLTYNGKTFTGSAAQQRYNWLQSTGVIGGRK